MAKDEPKIPTVIIVPAITMEGEFDQQVLGGLPIHLTNPIDCWDVHLTGRDIGRIVDADRRKASLTHQLLNQGKGCRNHG
jgi:hypothetical protein